jgi:hypothetical protein
MGCLTRIRASNWPMGVPIGQLQAPVQWTGDIGEPEGLVQLLYKITLTFRFIQLLLSFTFVLN